MRKVIVKPRRIPVVQQPRILTAAEQAVRAELRAKLYTAMLVGRLQRSA
jgi:hypothetical protein